MESNTKVTPMVCVFRYLEVSIEEWLEDKERQLEDSGQVELVFRPFLRWLDRNIEDVVTEGLTQVNRYQGLVVFIAGEDKVNRNDKADKNEEESDTVCQVVY